MTIQNVKAHVGTVGNERADKLVNEGAKLRFKLMEEAAEPEWFTYYAVSLYWGNRKPSD